MCDDECEREGDEQVVAHISTQSDPTVAHAQRIREAAHEEEDGSHDRDRGRAVARSLVDSQIEGPGELLSFRLSNADIVFQWVRRGRLRGRAA